MSVIAKMHVASSGTVPGGALVRLSCVYDQDLATASNEDIRFTKASPSGEATMEVRQGLQEGSAWYLLFDDEADPPEFAGCDFALKVRCHCVHDYGQSKQVEISTGYQQDGVPEEKQTSPGKHPPFHMKITIDNPHASMQFVPNRIYWLTLYRAARFTDMSEVTALARRAAAEPAPAD